MTNGAGRAGLPRMATGSRGTGGPIAEAPPRPRCIVSARYTDHGGPIYGSVEGTASGDSIVQYSDSAGMQRVVDIPTNRLTSGLAVEHQMLHGRPIELRYRFFLVPIEDGDVEVWRLCQVERTDEDDEVDGLFWVRFRPKGDDRPLLTLSVEDFRSATLQVSKEDYILEIGDWSQTDMTIQDLEDGMDVLDRAEVRIQHPSDTRCRILGRLGLVEWTTLNSLMRGRDHHAADEVRPAPARAQPPLESPRQVGQLPPTRPDITFGDALLSMNAGMQPSADPTRASGTFTHSPSSYGLATPQAGPSEGGQQAYCKYDYNPRRHCRHRSSLIFRGGDYQLMGTTPGDQLESLRSQEIIPSPGSGIDLFHCTWGFNWGELPLGISNIRFVGGGQSRKVEEPNVNKAITAAMKARNMTLTNMAELGNSTLQMSTTARRWYKPELVEIMVILDEYVRKAQMTEGSGASKLIVGAYVSLVEIALRVVCTALNGMSKESYKEDISAAKSRVMQTIALSSETFQLTVGIARTAEYHARMNGRGGGSHGGGGGKGGSGGNDGGHEAKRQRMGNDRNENKVPSNVVAALRNKEGKALCLGFINNNCTRKAGTCRFEHEAIPDGTAPEIREWINKQNKKS